MNRSSLLFCALSVIATVLLSVLGFSLAAMPREAVVAARTPTPAERLGDIDLGKDFGRVPVVDLVGYYLENPPAAPAAGGAASPKARRFGGC